ncbi:hypothetical protein [Mesorhizobium sp.]|uniref:hypothetical protein n=1 Tax=Mesorhizobium sp. TaxID=1871066 RepID=UPI000FE6C899|nr:hypothetical protein [Mesorhizobium sp.]RWQ14826.1 MAG: hypothetical protein EOR93_28000 [Mesorhizobium sp.]
MWIEVTLWNEERVFVNFDNVAHVGKSGNDRWFIRFVDNEISRLEIVATEAQVRGMLSAR